MAVAVQTKLRRGNSSLFRLTRQRIFFLVATILTFCLTNFLLTALPTFQPETAKLTMKTEPRKEQLRPLGVVAGRTAQLVGMDPKYYVYYKTASKSGKFKCISSKEVIPWSHVNDNYCDCPEDGSDEPATTACSFFAPHQYFFCTSTDPSKIPVAWMNDGICDCCAGEDETEKYCPNTCKSLKPRRQRSAN